MAESFDPYHKWLGISPKDQPVNHYRLLGIDLLESDPQVIESAADRQMAHLRSFQSGPQGALSQKLLNEISAARVCLLNAGKKAAYDQTLQAAAKPLAKAKPLPMAQPLPERPAVPKPTLTTRPGNATGLPPQVQPTAGIDLPMLSQRASTHKKSKPIWQQPVVWSVMLGAIALGLIGMIVFRTKPEPTDVAVKDKTALEPVVDSPPEVPAENEQSKDPAAAKVDPSPSVSPEQPMDLAETTPDSSDSPKETESKISDSLPDGIDLLKTIDLNRDVVKGEWKLDDGKLICAGGSQARVAVGPTPPERYRLDIEYQLISGDTGAQGIVVGDHQTLLNIDRPAPDGGVISGLHNFQGTYIEVSTDGVPEDFYTREPILRNGHARIVCLVEPGKVWVACNGKEIVNWSGDFSKPRLHQLWDIAEKNRLFLGAHESNVRYERAILTPLKSWPKRMPLGDEPIPTTAVAHQTTPAEADTKKPATKPESLPKRIDLLKSIDLKRDVVDGAWQLEEGDLVCPSGQAPKIVFGPTAPERYRLDIEYQHVKGTADCIGLVVGDHQAMLLMNMSAQGGVVSGIHQYRDQYYLQDHKESFPNGLYTTEPVLKDGHARLVCLVEPGRIWVACNGKQVVDWSGDFSEITLYPNWSVPDKNRFFLAGYNADIRYESVVLTPLKSWPKTMPLGNQTPSDQLVTNEDAVEQNTSVEPGAKGIDLLKSIDLKRDVVSGDWKLEDGNVISPFAEHARLVVGPSVPKRYRLDIDFQKGEGETGCIGLVVGDHQMLLLLDCPAHGGKLSGNHMYRDSFSDLSTEGLPQELFTFEPILQESHGRLICLVEPGRLWAACNGTQIMDWSGDFSELKLYDRWEVPNKDRIFLGSQKVNIRYERAILTPLKSWPKQLPIRNEPSTDEDLARQAIPDDAAQQAVKKQLKEVFEKEYAAAARPEGRKILAQQLIAEAIRSNLDAPERYVMLAEAAEMAAGAGESKLLDQALTALVEDYELPNWNLPLELFAQFATASKSAEARDKFSALATEWSQRAVDTNQYDAALKLATNAANAVAKSRDVDARKRATAYRDSVQQMQLGWNASRDALEVLKKTPDDAAANLTVGKFLCFSKQEWDAGLAHLAQGSNPTLQKLASDDLKLPTTSAPRLALGDQWYAVGEKLAGGEKTAAQDRAAYWYLQAEAELQGLEKARVLKKLKELGVVIDLLSMFKPSRTNSRGNWQVDKKALISPTDALAAVQFPYEPPTEYDIIVTAQRIKSEQSTTEGQDGIIFGLSHAGKQFLVVADWYMHGRGKALAVCDVDGGMPSDQTRMLSYLSLFGQQSVKVVVRVRKDRIKVEADGKVMLDCPVDYARLSVPQQWKPSDSTQLFIGTQLCSFRITQFDVVQVTR